MFTKKFQLTFSMATILLFVACGGDSSSSNYESKTEKISKRQYVIVNYHYPKETCNSSYLKERLKSIGATDIVMLVTREYVNCRSYGKSNNGRECLMQDLNYYGEPTCVTGMNRSTSGAFNSKMTDDVLYMENIQSNIVSEF